MVCPLRALAVCILSAHVCHVVVWVAGQVTVAVIQGKNLA